MSDNWIVQNLENALEVWNDKLSEIWQLITQSPQTFKGGSIWSVITSIHGALQAIGYALLVLFFVVGVVKTCGSFADLKKPEHAVKLFVRFAIAKGLISYGMELMLAELLEQDSSMWASVLYGIYGADDQIVAVALSQLGNVGGEPYWSWYGFGSRVEWCACFVSWCADQCGYIETGVITKYAGCVNGVNWFKDRGQWADNDIEPAPGMIIFFDWDNKGSSGPQDGESDHTGIVERVEDGIVYTVEGNSGDSCRENHYAVGYYEILGYGIPAY